MTSKPIGQQTVFIQNIFEVDKKQIFSSEKMRKTGNCIHNYVHSFFVEDF